MATAYTQPTQYKAPIKQWDTDLIGKALAYKQQTYDINKEKVQQFYNQLTTVELAKGGDREHLENRLNLLNQQVTQAGGMGDLSQSGAFDAISSYYGQAIDEKVENGYYGTLVGKKIKAEAEQAEKDGKYNDSNLEYSLQDYSKWVNDGQVGSEYRGNSKYVPYTDKWAVIQKAFKDVDPDIKIIPTSTGYQFINKKYEEVSPERVRSIMQNIVLSNPGVAQQIKVDAWSTFRGVDDTKALDVTNNLYENRIEQIDEAIKQTNVKLKSKPNDKELKAELQQYEKLKSDTKLELSNYNDNFSKNPSYYKEQYETNNLIQGAIDMYAKSNLIDISSITDVAALERLKHSNSISLEREKAKLKEEDDFYNKLTEYATKGMASEMKVLAEMQDRKQGDKNTGTYAKYTNSLIDDLVDTQATASNVDKKEFDDAVEQELTGLNNQIEASKNDINKALELNGLNPTYDGGDSKNLISLLDSEIESKETSDVKKQDLAEIRNKIIKIEDTKNELDANLAKYVNDETLQSIGTEGVRESGRNGRFIKFDKEVGEYYIEDTQTTGEFTGAVGEGLSIIGKGAGNLVSVTFDNIGSGMNWVELYPRENKEGLEALNLYYNNRGEFNRRYKDTEVMNTVKNFENKGYKNYESVLSADLSDSRFGEFVRTVENVNTNSISKVHNRDNEEYKDYLNRQKNSTEAFFGKTRTYITKEEAVSAIRDVALSGGADRLPIQIKDGIANSLSEIGYLGVKVDLTGDMNINTYSKEVNSLIGNNIDWSKEGNFASVEYNNGVGTIKTKIDGEEQDDIKVTKEQLSQYKNIGRVVSTSENVKIVDNIDRNLLNKIEYSSSKFNTPTKTSFTNVMIKTPSSGNQKFEIAYYLDKSTTTSTVEPKIVINGGEPLDNTYKVVQKLIEMGVDEEVANMVNLEGVFVKTPSPSKAIQDSRYILNNINNILKLQSGVETTGVGTTTAINSYF